jgi:8-amino-7-oxononanoate synthase
MAFPRATLDAVLTADRLQLRNQGLERHLPELPAEGVDFTSNDYLGLSRNRAVVQRARMALEEWGAGGRAARLLGGGSVLDQEAEQAVAEWLGAEAALLFPSGYLANLGLVTALAGPGDVILSDELNHASLVDAARLSRALVHTFRHADPADAGRLLATTHEAKRVFLLTESLFGMDGDRAPLGELAVLCQEHDAELVIDEAHAIGVVGPHGAGLWAELGRTAPPAVRIVTGGKALGVGGAFVVSSARLRHHLVNRARSFAFTTATAPAIAGGLCAAIPACRDADQARERCRSLARRVAASLGLPRPGGSIIPVVLGDAAEATSAAAGLREQGLDVRAVRPPTVPEGSSRLRVVCHDFNTDEEVDRLIGSLKSLLEGRPGEPPQTDDPGAPSGVALVVAGTDTGVGKTVVSAILTRALTRANRGHYWKPVQTGADDDTTTVEALTDAPAASPGYRFGLPASPHEAARAEGATIEPSHLDAELDRHLDGIGGSTLVVELAGGLLVPLTDEHTQLDWLAQRRPALVLVARSGLGTLNHTLLSLEALRARHLEPRALFLVGDPHASNRETLAAMGRIVHLFEVPTFADLDTAAIDGWLDRNDLTSVFPR